MQIINLHRNHGVQGIYIGRARSGRISPLGNIFPITKHSTRDEVCDRFDSYLEACILAKDPLITFAMRSLKEGDALLCFCHPQRCHGESIIRLWNQYFKNENRPRTLAYAGIGARITPRPILEYMGSVSKRLETLGYTLYLGHAD